MLLASLCFCSFVLLSFFLIKFEFRIRFHSLYFILNINIIIIEHFCSIYCFKKLNELIFIQLVNFSVGIISPARQTFFLEIIQEETFCIAFNPNNTLLPECYANYKKYMKNYMKQAVLF